MKLLITGGAGYIGSITNWYLKSLGHETVIFDSLANGYRQAAGDTPLVVGDLRDRDAIAKVFSQNRFDGVIHFAALALAGESMQKPYEYFQNNILGGLNLLEAMRMGSCKNIIFSSTCAVYGYPKTLPVTEEAAIGPVSVYGASKRNFEEILTWYETLYGITNVRLRYFNACGALPDGSLGEDHTPETHIIPVAIQSALGEKPEFTFFGNDYKTKDGTCVRDYIHVLDLADAHLRALEFLKKDGKSEAINLGVGRGYSNMEIISSVEKVTGKTFDKKFAKRRWGDPDAIWADNTKAKKLLSWQPQYTDIEEIIKTAFVWHKNHPNGWENK